MIDQLSFIKEDLAIVKQHFGKGMYQRKYIQKIQTGDLETVNGKLIYNLEQQIATWKQPQIIQINRIKQFWQIKKKNFDSIIFFIKTLYSKQFTLFVNSNDESKITDRYDLLQQWLQRQRTKRVVQFELLFRASQHLFSAPTFHQKCNNIPNLLIIIKSLTGKVFGGFIPNAMMQSTSDVWISDETKTSFIFSLDSQECYPISQYAKSFCCNKTYGPTFGNVDFYICDKANISDSSYGNFPKSYGNQTTKTVLNITDLTGSLNNNNFRVSQYEVYKVVFS